MEDETADETNLEDIPDDLMCSILSRLDMRDVARASSSCSTFLRGWERYPRLTFDEATLRLRPPHRKASEQEREDHANNFVRLVDAIVMSRHRSDDTAPLEAVKIKCGFLRGDKHAHCVDRWVHFALAAATTRRLELDFCPEGCYNPSRLFYDFPCSLLSAGTPTAAALEHLYLRQGTLVLAAGGHPAPPLGLINLASLVLAFVSVSGEDLDRLLSSCHKLRSLELERCDGLEYVRVSPPRDLSKQLKFLAVKNCWSITTIDVSGSAIESLQLAGHNLVASLLLGSKAAPAPAVTSASFDLEPGPPVAGGALPRLELLRLANVVPSVETLTFSLPWTMEADVPPYSTQSSGPRIFHNLRRADFTLEMLGRDESADFRFLHRFLDAAPALKSLSLDVMRLAPALEDPGTEPLASWHPRLPHHSLETVLFTGFDGDLGSLQLVLHILKKARALRHISLKPAWLDDDEDMEYYAGKIRLVRESIARHIVPAVPSGSGIVLQVI